MVDLWLKKKEALLLLLEKDGVIVRVVEVYGVIREGAKVMEVDDAEMILRLDVVLQQLQQLRLQLVAVVGLGLRHDVAALLLASLRQQH